MIRIEKGKSKDLNTLSKEFYQKINAKENGKYQRGSLAYRLKQLISKTKDLNEKAFFDEFCNNNYELLEKACTAEPIELESIIVHIDKLLKAYNLGKLFSENNGTVKPEPLGEKIANIFKYSAFRASKNCEWLIEELDIPVCPYCNRVETFTITNPAKKDKKKLLLDFDHYYPKARYPYLALSFYNLIPSCHTCNSHFKKDNVFKRSTHLHPYIDSYNDIYRFSTTLILEQNIDSFNIILKEIDPNNADNARCGVTTADFGILEIYQMYKDKVLALINKKNAYPDSKIQELLNLKVLGKSKFLSEAEVIAHLNECPFTEREIRYTVLGKFRRDFALEYGLYCK